MGLVVGALSPYPPSTLKLALVSDLHGNLVALDAVLADARAAAVDRVVCLGDVVDLGPQPEETVRRLRDANVACVRGNHDPLDEHPAMPVLLEIERWTRDALSAESRAWLEALPMTLEVDLDGARALLAHGSPKANTDSLLASTPEPELDGWGTGGFDLVACGHTHVALTRHHRGRPFVNVGSVGMPFEEPFSGRPPRVLRACDYAVVSARAGVVSIEHRRLPLDFDAFARTMRESGFPNPDAWLAQWA